MSSKFYVISFDPNSPCKYHGCDTIEDVRDYVVKQQFQYWDYIVIKGNMWKTENDYTPKEPYIRPTLLANLAGPI
jgi:hypothetical protein